MDNDFGSGNSGGDEGNSGQQGMIDDMLGNIGGPSDEYPASGLEDNEEGDTTYGVDADRGSYKHSDGHGGNESAIEHESTVTDSNGNTRYSHKEHRKDANGN